MPQSVDCQSKNIIPVRLLNRQEYKQLTPCSNFQFFLPDNLSRYIESSEFSAEKVLTQDFIEDTNLTEQELGSTDKTGLAGSRIFCPGSRHGNPVERSALECTILDLNLEDQF